MLLNSSGAYSEPWVIPLTRNKIENRKVLLFYYINHCSKIKKKDTNNERKDNVIQLSFWIYISNLLSLHHRRTLSLAVTAPLWLCMCICIYCICLCLWPSFKFNFTPFVLPLVLSLSSATPPSSVSYMSLLFISLISDCFFPLESVSSCQYFPWGERRDLCSSWRDELPF